MAALLNLTGSAVSGWWHNTGATLTVVTVSALVTTVVYKCAQRALAEAFPLETAEQREENSGINKLIAISAFAAGAIAPTLLPIEYKTYSAKKMAGVTLLNIGVQYGLEYFLRNDPMLNPLLATNTRRACTVLAAPLMSSLGYLDPQLVTVIHSGVVAGVTAVLLHEPFHIDMQESFATRTAVAIVRAIGYNWYFPVG